MHCNRVVYFSVIAWNTLKTCKTIVTIAGNM